MQRRSGFTLIELMIVMAILAVIAAISIPNLINAIHRGRQKQTMGKFARSRARLRSLRSRFGILPGRRRRSLGPKAARPPGNERSSRT